MKMMKKAGSIVLCAVVAMSTVLAPLDSRAASSIKLSAKKATLTVGKSKTLTLKKGKKKLSGVKWSTSNKKVATVKNGKVKAKKAGKATITAKYKKKKYACKVTVKAKTKKQTTDNSKTTEEVTLYMTPEDGVIRTEGTSVTIRAVPRKSGSGTPSYQWLQNGDEISGATKNTFEADEAGSYSCVITYNNLTLKSGTVVVKSVVESPVSDVVKWSVEEESFDGSYAYQDPDTGKNYVLPIKLKREYVSFNPWPTTVNQVKYVINNCQDPFVIGALYVVAQSNYVYTNITDSNCGKLAFDMLDQIQLGAGVLTEPTPTMPTYCLSNSEKQNINASGYNQLAYKKDGKTLSTQKVRDFATRTFCKGATPENNYAPNGNPADINDKTKWKIKVDQYVYSFDQVDGDSEDADACVKSEKQTIEVPLYNGGSWEEPGTPTGEMETLTDWVMPALHKNPKFITVSPAPYKLYTDDGSHFEVKEHPFTFRIGLVQSKKGVWIPSDYVKLKDATHDDLSSISISRYNYQANGLFSNNYVAPEDANDNIF